MKINPLGIIFSDTHVEDFIELTAGRTTASIPFGGRYRLIDFTLSNMTNSGITKVGVITKSNYQSLLDHISSGKEWDLSHKNGGLFILPPFGRAHTGIYKSRLEALNGIQEFIRKSSNEYVVLSDCNVIANMNLQEPLEFHVENNADITVVYREIPAGKSRSELYLTINTAGDGRVTDVRINSEETGEIKSSLNIWIVGKRFLEQVIPEMVSRGFSSWERDVIQKGVGQYRIYGWEFKGYAGQIGSMLDYYNISMDLLNLEVREELFYKYGHIFTKVRDEVPAKYNAGANVTDSYVSDGCVIDGTVDRSILFREVTVGPGSHISNSIVMQGTHIGSNVTLNYMVVGNEVFINDNRAMMGCHTCPIHISKGSVI
jgi:glucose-1-phosphate adenylyltransferase